MPELNPTPDAIEAHAAQGFEMMDIARLLGASKRGVFGHAPRSDEAWTLQQAFDLGRSRWVEAGKPTPPRASTLIAQAVHAALASKEMTRPELRDALGYQHDDLNLAIEQLQEQGVVSMDSAGAGPAKYRADGAVRAPAPIKATPPTSPAASASPPLPKSEPDTVQTQRVRVLALLKEGPATSDELAVSLRWPIKTVSAVCSALHDDGFITQDGERKNPRGPNSKIWAAVEIEEKASARRPQPGDASVTPPIAAQDAIDTSLGYSQNGNSQKDVTATALGIRIAENVRIYLIEQAPGAEITVASCFRWFARKFPEVETITAIPSFKLSIRNVLMGAPCLESLPPKKGKLLFRKRAEDGLSPNQSMAAEHLREISEPETETDEAPEPEPAETVGAGELEREDYVVTLRLSPQAGEIIEELVGYGIYGRDRADVCERFVDQRLIGFAAIIDRDKER